MKIKKRRHNLFKKWVLDIPTGESYDEYTQDEKGLVEPCKIFLNLIDNR